MSKEWLDDAKKILGHIKGYDIYEKGNDLEVLERIIEQAERVPKLESENRALKAVAKNNKNLGEESLRQNKHYRESINLALNHIHTGNFTLATVELNKALLKEVEQ